MTKKSRREFLRNIAPLLVLPAASIVPVTLEDILDLNGVEAQDRRQAPNGAGASGQATAPVSVTERLSFNIALRNYDTHSIMGRIDRTSVGEATLNAVHTSSTYHIQINSLIDRNVFGSWVRMQSNLRGTFSHVNGTPNFQPRYYWLRYQEGGRGTTPKDFVADIHFDFSTHTSQAYGYHQQQGQATRRYGSPSARLHSRFTQSTRDLISAMMQARFLPARRRRQLNTIVEGVPRAVWLQYNGTGRFSPPGTPGYPTRMYRIHFPRGILPDTSWDLHFQFHDAPNRTPLAARLVKSDGSTVIFNLRNPTTAIPRTNLYAAPQRPQR